MKFLHLADLHIGKRLHNYPLLEEQEAVLQQALDAAKTCDAVLISGDVYDKSNPSAEAMEVFDHFLTSLAALELPIYLISGNHDSGKRIAYFSDLIAKQNIFTYGTFDGTVHSYPIADTNITVHLLPFLRPADVRRFFPEETVETHEDAMRVVLAHTELASDRVHILLAHQFITGAALCESEELTVGGLEQISASLFAGFDYVALGHLHRPQHCTRETIRYAGSPLKYSISEADHQKSFTILDVTADGMHIDTVPIQMLRDVRLVEGNYADLMAMPYTEDYVQITLTNENVPPDARLTLRSVFPRMLRFVVRNSKTKYEVDVAAMETFEKKTPPELFVDFFTLQNNGVPPTERQLEIVRKLFAELQEEGL